MTFLRFLMLLALVAWLGGIIFFSAVVAPTLFGTLPSRSLAGMVVTRSLTLLHWIGIIAGLVFIVASAVDNYLTAGTPQLMSWRHLLVLAMLVLTLASQFAVTPRMAALRIGMGDIETVAPSDPRRLEFNRLHGWSTRLEAGVLLLGLAVVASLARQPGR